MKFFNLEIGDTYSSKYLGSWRRGDKNMPMVNTGDTITIDERLYIGRETNGSSIRLEWIGSD